MKKIDCRQEVSAIRILLAEDEKRMADALQELLQREGCYVDCVYDGSTALRTLERGNYDVAVMDIMMPEMNGFSVTAKAREKGVTTPILMLTARGGIDDKVEGLESGADDYLTKPFMTRELLARLRALTRRNMGYREEEFSAGDITLRQSTAELVCITTGQSVRLPEKEYSILEYMMINKGKILTKEQLAVKIWGYESEAEYNKVEVYMSFTRKKLAFVGSKTEIKAVRGIGYELRWNDV